MSGTVVVGALALPSPARAETDQAGPGESVSLSSYLTGTTVAIGSAGKTATLRYFAYAGSNAQMPPTVRVTIDATATGAVRVELRRPTPGCAASAAGIITCERTTVGGANLNAEVPLRFTPAAGAAVGDHGPLTVTVTAPGADTWVQTQDLTVGAAGPDLKVTDSRQTLAPGAKTGTRPVISNNGSQVATTILLSLSSGSYSRFPVHFRNCHYQTDDYGYESGVCLLQNVRLAPGETLIPDLRTPLPIQVKTNVPGQFRYSRYDRPSPYQTYLWYGVDAYDSKSADERLNWPAGDGPSLRWDRGRTHLAASAAEVDPTDNYGSLNITVSPNNPTDIAAQGATVNGAVGSVVSATVGIRNNGPAAVDATPEAKGGDAADPDDAGLRFTPPPNTEVVDVIRPPGPVGGPYQDVFVQTTPEGVSYLVLPYSLADGKQYQVEFKLRIKAPGTGTGTVVGQGGVDDPNVANNTATVSVSST